MRMFETSVKKEYDDKLDALKASGNEILEEISDDYNESFIIVYMA